VEGHLLSEEKDTLNWEQYEETVERFIQTIARNMNLYGINPSVGRLYGVLYFAENPMTLDDMREALSMSKTSMSTGVRILSDMKMVESIHKKGVRKDLYQTEDDWYKSFTSLFGTRWRKQTETNIEEADEALEKLQELRGRTTDESLINKIDQDIDKLTYANNYYQWLMQLIKVVESGDIFKLVPKN
jgi:HTH-type transcriptional regulator, glycine betaine synthesis regulator